MDSVLAFLKKVQDVIGQFSDPFQLEDILAYIDSLSAGDSAAKTAVDIALHDLVGKLLQATWYKIWGLDHGRIAAVLAREHMAHAAVGFADRAEIPGVGGKDQLCLRRRCESAKSQECEEDMSSCRHGADWCL